MKDELMSRIYTLLTERYYVPTDKMTELTIYDHLDLDSLVLLEISVTLAKEFSISVPDGLVTSEMTIEQSVNEMIKFNQLAA